MTTSFDELCLSYLTALERYLTGGSPDDLAQAYELGRKSLSEGLNLLEVVDAHQEFLAKVIAPLASSEERSLYLARAKEFFLEAVAPFDMALRGYLEANQELAAANISLQMLNKQLSQARDQALEASRFKSEFLANMSHEIRTPMSGILGMTELLSRTELNSLQRDYLAVVKEEGSALLSIINDILDYSKIEAGKLTLEMVSFELLKVVESVGDILAAQARQKGLTLLTYIDPDMPPAVLGDPGRLRQILINLAGNAIKFSDEGEVVVSACLERADQKSACVKFSVSDQGIGMTEEQVNMLFRPFVQVDGSISRKYSGTGLGLSISKRLVEMMGGCQIEVKSAKGRGSTFSFVLPFAVVSETRPEKRAIPQLKGTRVLVVDDEANARKIMHSYLCAWGMADSLAADAREALSMLRQAVSEKRPFDLAIVDLVLPEVTGTELGKMIQADENLKDTKLILVTAFDKPGGGEEALGVGFSGYLTKPIRQSQLFDLITSVMVGEELAGQNLKVKEKTGKSLAAKPAPKVFRRELILLVEDHPINQKVVLLFLKELGFEAHLAENGRQALEALERIPYDLVFMDVQMPAMNGFDATRAIRQNETRTGLHVPIVAMTAHAMEGSREECLAAGMDDYISKPIDPQALRAIIARWLPLKETEESPSTAPNLEPAAEAQGLGIDLDRLAKSFGSDFVAPLIDVFLDEAPVDLAEMEEALALSDKERLVALAHRFKGASATLQAPKLISLCARLDQAARKQNWLEARQSIRELKRAVEDLAEQVKHKR